MTIVVVDVWQARRDLRQLVGMLTDPDCEAVAITAGSVRPAVAMVDAADLAQMRERLASARP